MKTVIEIIFIYYGVLHSCMDASIAVRPVFNRFQSVVITSGVGIEYPALHIFLLFICYSFRVLFVIPCLV